MERLILNNLDRPSWDDYFMSMAILASQRSIDSSTKHGCVLVDQDNTILSIGYNSAVRGSDDANIPMTRPEKYPMLEHSERNAIYSAARNGVPLKGCTIYASGFPCTDCLRAMVQVGAKRIIYGPIGSVMLTDEIKKVCNKILENKAIEFKYHSGSEVSKILSKTIDYFNSKTK